ncbi:MAG: DUF4387 domain-containing protein [Thermaerobacterales bacterium]
MNRPGTQTELETVPIQQLASVIRSKNAGPFWVSVDIMCDTREQFERLRDSGQFDRHKIARLYNLSSRRISEIIFFEPGLAITFNIRRRKPAGSPGDRDMYGAQYYVPILQLRA